MTEEQLSIFKSSGDSNVIIALFRKKHSHRLSKEYIKQLSSQQKYENCLYLYKAASNQPESFKMALVPYALHWGPKANIYDFELFKKYVEYQDNIMGGGGMLTELKYMLKQKLFDRNMGSTFHNVFVTLYDEQQVNQDKTVEQYLTEFAFQNNGDLSRFRRHKD